MRVDYFCILTLFISTFICVNARKQRKKKLQAPSWKMNSMPKSGLHFQAVELGDQFELNCKANGKPKPSVTWLHNGVEIRQDDDRYEIKKGVLKIKATNSKDSGNYVCSVVNSQGQLDFNYQVDVTVTPWPLEVEVSKNRTASVGSIVSFTCVVLNDPLAVIKWKRPAPLLKGGLDNKFTDDKSAPSELLLTDIQEEDEGLYTCEARNSKGLRKKSVWLDVTRRPTQPPFGINPDDFSVDKSRPSFPESGRFDIDEFPFTTTKRPRHRGKEKKQRRKNRKNKDRKTNNRKKNKDPTLLNESENGRSNDRDNFNYPMTTTLSSPFVEDVITTDIITKPTIWGMYPNGDAIEDADDRNRINTDGRIHRNTDGRIKFTEITTVTALESNSNSNSNSTASFPMDIRSWKLYTAVGVLGGLMLVTGLLAITYTVYCKMEDEAVYKSTPV